MEINKKDLEYLVESIAKLKQIALDAYDGKIKKREEIEYPFNVLLMRTLETMLKGDVPPND